MDLKRKARCKAIIDVEVGLGGEMISAGHLGRVVATRTLTGVREYLIKWDGRSGHCSHSSIGIEIIRE
jgi:hypothetical protein